MTNYPEFVLSVARWQYPMRQWATKPQVSCLQRATGVRIDCTRVAKMDASAAINALKYGRAVVLKQQK